MNRLSDEYISACRVDRGKILRGENMSRIETFVDAAFAFAFTMLVIRHRPNTHQPRRVIRAIARHPRLFN